MRAQNEELRAENERLRSEVERLRADVARAGVEDESTVVEEAEPARGEDPGGAASEPEEASGGGDIAVAGPGDVGGEAVPGIKPDDLPLPAGAVIEYSDEGDYNFTVELVLDSDLRSVTAFYEERLRQGGWEEVDRTEYEQDGLEGVETSWERGTYVPEGSPQGDPNYEQTDETLSLVLQEIQPSGVGGRLSWNSYKLLDETS